MSQGLRGRLGDLADRLIEGVSEGAGDLREAAGSVLEPSLRLGVTGLSGAGKTVFITALVSSLLARGRLHALSAEGEGRLIGVLPRPQPDPLVPRFAHETHAAALTAVPGRWPVSTRSVSQLRLAIRYQPAGFLGGLTGPQTLNLDVVDYPGEWLLDLALMEQDYETWAAGALAGVGADDAAGWPAALAAADPAAALDEPAAEALATAWTGHLQAARAAGRSHLTPGRFLLPGDMAGSPALTFAPLPRPVQVPRDSLYAAMRERFETYKRVVVKPFFRDHFARLDRQVVLVDALGALARGPEALAELTRAMGATLAAFRHGASGWLDRLIGRRRIDRLLFVASKADHLHHEHHPRLSRLVDAMLAEAAARARFSGTRTAALSIAAVRATSEQVVTRQGARLALVRGRRLDTGAEVAVHAGDMPEDARALLAAALEGTPADWPQAGFATVPFAPPAWGPDPWNGPPHIRLDRAIEFLIGDRLE